MKSVRGGRLVGTDRTAGVAVCVAAVSCLASVAGMSAETEDVATGRAFPCVVDDFPTSVIDYRQRNSSEQNRWFYQDNWNSHNKRLMELIRAGRYTRDARSEIEWTLFRWPNHLPVLQAAIEYDLKGGRPYEFRPVECYFARARVFAPDDIAVMQAEAVYFWKKDQKELAKKSLEDALAVAPESADVHYNLGLLYVDMGRYAEALQHAWAAYGSGYPLPGLKNKLTKAGQWRDPPPNAPPSVTP